MRKFGQNDSYFTDLIDTGTYELCPMSGILLNTKTRNQVCQTINGTKLFKHFDKKQVKQRSIAIHRLMWLVFVGPLDSNSMVIHVDGDCLNNKLSNLKKVNRIGFVALHRQKIIESNFLKSQGYKLDALSIVELIRNDYANNKITYQNIADKYGISVSSAFKIINKHCYKDV